MSEYVIPKPEQPAVPVRGGGLFPVRRIYCVGRNYAEHVREMGGDAERELPFFFAKPADAVVIRSADMPYPPMTKELHHEMELVVAIGKGGANIPEREALNHVYGYAAGIDMTRRDLQAEAKKAGRPWEMSKGFDHSAPIGEIAPASQIGHPAQGKIVLSVNGKVRQNSDIANMIWPVSGIIAELSRFVRLEPGDLIFTGTPEGVGPVSRGDVLEGSISGVGTVRVRVV
ncbi:MAG: fumarylacetoacetate hydrolase family protein [Acetobacteraceae bacterium]|nr:fumarylacetoacetate hydrolase family protein [Acetobacteraceae bacterium]